ncbi:FHA domain-containing protein [Specibacter sp. NPDC057265]|uniref:FHA domain-containing protein n=1 Tax=Specibacter sp. NPDC057265 TaxID=3346075 RepID=UPI0036345C7A
MVSSTYSSGSWIGIVRSGSVIALSASTDPRIVTQLWDCLAQEPTLHGVLNEVTEAFGTGLTNMPPFAIVVRSDRLHVILRGDMELVASSPAGTDTVSGRDVTTWSERSLPLPEAFMLTLADDLADGGFPGGAVLELPVAEAVVRLQSLTVGQAAQDAQAAHDAGDGVDHESAEQYAAADFLADFDTEELVDQEPTTAEHDDGMALLTPVETPLELAAYAQDEQGVDEYVEGHELDPQDFADEDAYAEFAMAAEAADAEWNAQLAPVARLDANQALELAAGPDGIGLEGPEPDMNLTIHAYEDEEALTGHDPEPAQEPVQEPAQQEVHGAAEDSEDAAADGTGSGSGPEHGVEDGAEPGTGEAAPSAEDAVDDGFTINYDFLFGATVAKSVEAAAVRTDEDAPEAATGATIMPPMPSAPPLAGSNNGGSNNGGRNNGGQADSGQADGGGDAAAVVAPVEPESEDAGLMIDSVPWASQGQSAATPAAGLPSSEAAVAAPTGPAASHVPYDPDHDGHTVMRSEVQDEQDAQEAPAPLESRPPTGPMVLARMCPNGHANPPSRASCWSCATAINAEPREVGRPRLGTMHISTGEVVELDHSLIIGRQPSVSRVMGGAMPRLVQVKSGNGDISRSHVEVRLDGWDVLLVDLKATNGTVLVREGQSPRRLSQGEEAILLNGDIAELGDGVSLLFDGLL